MRSFIAGRKATMAHEEHDVEAPAVTIRQGIARRVNAQDVAIRQGGALQITGGTVRLGPRRRRGLASTATPALMRRRHSGPVTRRTTGRRPSASAGSAPTPRVPRVTGSLG